MSTQTTLGEPQRPEKTAEWNREVVFTANGSARASRLVYRTGALVGMESLNIRPPDDVPVEFVDWPFSKLDEYRDVGELFDAHHGIVREERPKLAVAPDVEGDVSLEQAVEYGRELARHADVVIVVPKTVLPTDVPPGFRVGMPCQERYGPTPWQWTQYRPVEEVHLLGGSPVKHHEILKYGVPVESVDTTSPLAQARWGDYWDGRKWASADRGFYWSLKQSYRAMRLSLNKDRRVWSPRARNRRLDWEEAWKEYNPDTDLWGPDEIPGPPRHEGEVPSWLPDGVL